MRILRAFILGLLSLGVVASAQDKPGWTQESIAGITLDLVDPVKVERMGFSPEGHVLLTCGSKGGSLTAPVCQWRVVEGRLQIYDVKMVSEELTLVSRDTREIVALRRDGQTARYQILRR